MWAAFLFGFVSYTERRLMLIRVLSATTFITVLLSAQDARPVLTKVAFEGLTGLPPGPVVEAAGLTLGSPVEQSDLEAACGRLLATGLLLGCQFRFADGLATFQVAQAPPEQDVRIDLPGVGEKEFWAWAAKNAPLLTPRMPGTNDAVRLYTAAVQKFVSGRLPGEQVESRIETTLATHETFLVFRLANLPRIAAVSFTGNASIGADRLEEAMLKPAIGAEYSDLAFQHLLDLNVRPLYEELGKLSVSFPNPRVTPDGKKVKILTIIDEGPVYRLRSARVLVDGAAESIPALPVGEAANWKLLNGAVEARVAGLRGEGYLDAASRVSRRLDPAQRAVDADIVIRRGQRYVFGKVIIKGLSASVMDQALALWKLKEGEPAVEQSASEFVDRVFKQLPIHDEVRGASIHTQARPNTNIVDYTVNFR
jgi:outer membrane protein assembly factor BamA